MLSADHSPRPSPALITIRTRMQLKARHRLASALTTFQWRIRIWPNYQMNGCPLRLPRASGTSLIIQPAM